MDVSAGAFGFHHALGNLFAHRRHGCQFAPKLRQRHWLGSSGNRTRLRSGWSRSRTPGWLRRCWRSARFCCRAVLLHEIQDVVFGDAATQARAGHSGKINIIFAGNTTNQRRGANAFALARLLAIACRKADDLVRALGWLSLYTRGGFYFLFWLD